MPRLKSSNGRPLPNQTLQLWHTVKQKSQTDDETVRDQVYRITL